jgi:hypothetical protein
MVGCSVQIKQKNISAGGKQENLVNFANTHYDGMVVEAENLNYHVLWNQIIQVKYKDNVPQSQMSAVWKYWVRLGALSYWVIVKQLVFGRTDGLENVLSGSLTIIYTISVLLLKLYNVSWSDFVLYQNVDRGAFARIQYYMQFGKPSYFISSGRCIKMERILLWYFFHLVKFMSGLCSEGLLTHHLTYGGPSQYH